MTARTAALIFVFTAAAAWGEEYSVGNPTQALSAPVYLTRPATGAVEVTNLPEVQEVRVVGGKMDGPTEVTGEVGIRASAPLPVEITNSQKGAQDVKIVGPVWLDDARPVRVWIDNSWSPDGNGAQEFTAFAYQGRFLPGDDRHRRTAVPRSGKVFHLTDVLVDVRPDAQLKVRLLAPAANVGGAVSGVEFAEFPLAVLDTRRAPSAQFATPVPITGEFVLEVELLSAGQGGYFSVVARGYYLPKL